MKYARNQEEKTKSEFSFETRDKERMKTHCYTLVGGTLESNWF